MLRWCCFSEFSQKIVAFSLIITIFLRERVKERTLAQKDGVLVVISSAFIVAVSLRLLICLCVFIK